MWHYFFVEVWGSIQPVYQCNLYTIEVWQATTRIRIKNRILRQERRST